LPSRKSINWFGGRLGIPGVRHPFNERRRAVLRRYKFNGLEYQFEQGTQPAGAEAVDEKPAKQPARKAARPRNKAAMVANKAATADE
jgi:hypothetical protein